jgi:hypothetical protein
MILSSSGLESKMEGSPCKAFNYRDITIPILFRNGISRNSLRSTSVLLPHRCHPILFQSIRYSLGPTVKPLLLELSREEKEKGEKVGKGKEFGIDIMLAEANLST